MKVPITFLLVAGFILGFNAEAQDLSNVNKPGALVHQPKVSFDGSKMVFMADYDGRSKPYISSFNQDSSKWEEPQLLFSQDINGSMTFQYPQLSYDNQSIIISGAEINGDYNIYTSSLTGSEWDNPKLLEIGLNSEIDELGASWSANGKKILFTRPFNEAEKKDEYCFELWAIEKDETNTWLAPEKLEPAYNTGCNCDPYIANDNISYYYSSYEPIRDNDGKIISRNQFNLFWAKNNGFLSYTPKSLQNFIGEEDARSISIANDSIVYYALGNTKVGTRKQVSKINIKVIDPSLKPEPMTFVRGKVTEKNGNNVLADITIIDPFTSQKYQQVVTDASGYFQSFVPANHQYSVIASSEGYSIQSKLLSGSSLNEEVNFQLFENIQARFNVFDAEFYFPIEPEYAFYDANFSPIEEFEKVDEASIISIGKEMNVIFTLENYFSDTLNLPLHQEIIFSEFDFDIELRRKIKQVAFSFSDESTGDGLGLEITVYNVTRNEKTKRYVKDGSIDLDLRDGEVYEISTSAQGYSYFNSELDLSKEEDVERVDAKLKSIKDQSIVLNNIFFEVGSFTLSAASYQELDKLVKYLIENISFDVEILAHTDDTGGESFNLQLSNLRANSVLEYLQDHSINNERLIARGYGETTPLVENTSEANRSKNRRVEFKILNETE